jgi:cell division septation protein DedD
MSFAADHRWPFWGKVPRSVQSNGVWYDITIKYIDLGTDTLSLEYMDYSGRLRTRTIRKQDSRRWVTTTVQLYDAYLNGGLPGGTDLRISADPDRGGHDEIIHMIMIKGHAGGDPTPTPVPPPTPTPTPTPFYEVRVAAGNRAVRDRGGALWSADQPYTPGWWGYVGGAVYTTSVPVLADTPALFTTERFWREPGGYRFDVPNGVYQVDLAFAETLRTTPGQRVFDVLIEGTTVLRHFDIAAEVGVNRPVERSVLVSVSDGQLTIDFIPIADTAKVNALRVVAMPSPAMTATPTPTATRPTNQPDIGGTPTPPLEPTVTALEEHYLRTLSLVQRLLSILKGMFQP